jgi:hypothetical protein
MAIAEALKEWRELPAGSLLPTIVNIRNVRDLMLTMVRRHSSSSEP